MASPKGHRGHHAWSSFVHKGFRVCLKSRTVNLRAAKLCYHASHDQVVFLYHVCTEKQDVLGRKLKSAFSFYTSRLLVLSSFCY